MKRSFICMSVLGFVLGTVGLVLAEDDPLRAQEKQVHKEFADVIPADKIINVDQFYKIQAETRIFIF